MCNLYTIDAKLADWARDFEAFLGLKLALPAGAAEGRSNLTWRSPMYPKYQGLFARPVDPAEPEAGLEPVVGRWGVVPFFHKGPAGDWKFPTNNCRSEEMHAKPSFRDAVKTKRCILPATGFCEHTGPKGAMTRHTITRAAGGPLFLAGLWASHDHAGERTESYTMLMQAAREGDDMHPFHDRQPVVLDRASARVWLDLKADYREVLTAPARGTLAFDPPAPVLA
jgi:putative SOS response-associated peptidase YedK